MNIIDYEILINESTMHVISYLVLFIAIIVIGGWLTDLCIWPDTPMYMLSIILSVIVAFASTCIYSKFAPNTDATYEVRIAYENTLGKPISVSEKDIITKIQNNDIGTNTSSQNYIYSFEIDKELYKELEKLEEKRANVKGQNVNPYVCGLIIESHAHTMGEILDFGTIDFPITSAAPIWLIRQHIKNDKIKPEILETYITSRKYPKGIRLDAIAFYPKPLSTEIYISLLKNADPAIRGILLQENIRIPDTPVWVLEILANDKNADISRKAIDQLSETIIKRI